MLRENEELRVKNVEEARKRKEEEVR